MIPEEDFKDWVAKQEAELEHINAEIFKTMTYLHCLYQRKDAVTLSSYPGGFRLEKDNE